MALLADGVDAAVVDGEREGVLAGGEGGGGKGVDVRRGERVATTQRLAVEREGALPHHALEEELVVAGHRGGDGKGLGVDRLAHILVAGRERAIDRLSGGRTKLGIAQGPGQGDGVLGAIVQADRPAAGEVQLRGGNGQAGGQGGNQGEGGSFHRLILQLLKAGFAVIDEALQGLSLARFAHRGH